MSGAGRPRLPDRRAIILRLDENLLFKLYTLRPKLQSPNGGTRYGALTKYFTELVIRDLAEIESRIKGNKDA